jgi:hypothetical protein
MTDKEMGIRRMFDAGPEVQVVRRLPTPVVGCAGSDREALKCKKLPTAVKNHRTFATRALHSHTLPT